MGSNPASPTIIVTTMFARALITVLFVLVAVLVWLHRGYRKQIREQGVVNRSIRTECDSLMRSERMARAEILGLERMLEFAKLPHDVQEEIVVYVKTIEEQERVRLAALTKAHQDEYWSYLRANFPDWFRFKRCHCGGSMGEAAAGRGRNRLTTGSPPFLHRKCTVCGSVEELRDRQYGDHLEFRQRHGLWHPF